MNTQKYRRLLLALPIAGLVLTAGILFLPGWVKTLRATQRAVACYTELLAAVNTENIEGVRRLCSARYLAGHEIKAASEGGIVGMPRNIHKNFQAWCEGEQTLLCPTNRVGPVYAFVYEADAWKFDGPIGILKGGLLIRSPDDMTTTEVGSGRL